MDIIKKITAKQINPNVPEFRVGDTLRVDVRIIEGNKERIQAFEGVCTERKGSGVSETFTVRKKSAGIGVERTFPVNSPKIDKITVVRKGKVRRAKLRFLRDKIANYRIKERNNKEKSNKEN
jgi:large subunit ribosomal protein L19